MESLRNYLNSMAKAEQENYASACRTSLGYLRKALSTKQQLGVELVVRLHKHSDGRVLATDLRPDVDWGEFASLTSGTPDRAA